MILAGWVALMPSSRRIWPSRPGRLLLAVRDEVGHDFPSALGDAGDVRANALLIDRLRVERPVTPCSPRRPMTT